MWERALLEITHPGAAHKELLHCAQPNPKCKEALLDVVDFAMLRLVEEIDRCTSLDLRVTDRRGAHVTLFTSRPPIDATAADHTRLLAMLLPDLIQDPEWPDGVCASPELMTRFLCGVALTHLRYYSARTWDTFILSVWEEIIIELRWPEDQEHNPWTRAHGTDALRYARECAMVYLARHPDMGFASAHETGKHLAQFAQHYGHGHVTLLLSAARVLLGPPRREEVYNTLRRVWSVTESDRECEQAFEGSAQVALEAIVDRYMSVVL